MRQVCRALQLLELILLLSEENVAVVEDAEKRALGNALETCTRLQRARMKKAGPVAGLRVRAVAVVVIGPAAEVRAAVVVRFEAVAMVWVGAKLGVGAAADSGVGAAAELGVGAAAGMRVGAAAGGDL